MFKMMDKKIIAILRKLVLLNWPYALATIVTTFWKEIKPCMIENRFMSENNEMCYFVLFIR